MENNPVLLKSSMFGGFKKKDVLSYIFELNESTQESQQKFAEQIEDLSQSRNDLAQKVIELEARLASVQADFDDANTKLGTELKKNEESEALIEQMRTEASTQLSALNFKTDEVKRFTMMNNELAEKNRILEEKRAQVELAASQIADMLGKAREDADRIIEQAQQDAAKISEDSQKKADGVIKNANDSANNLLKTANSSLDGAYAEFDGFCSELETLKATISDATSCISERMEDITGAMRKARESASQKPGTLPALTYDKLQDASEQPCEDQSEPEEQASALANDILGKYGVRRDDSGFFRLAAER